MGRVKSFRSIEEVEEHYFPDLILDHLEKDLVKHFKHLVSRDVIIASAPRQCSVFVGKSLEEYAASNHMGAPEAFLKLMLASRLRAVVFKRVDHSSGYTKYVYHGNDGTSFPWNDTAQLNYLIPEVREAVIQTILHVARKFPIIRFEA